MADKLKNLLLAVLLLIMIALLVMTFLVSVRGSLGDRQLLRPQEEERTGQEVPLRDMGQPEVLALLGEMGLRLARESQEYGQLYQQAQPLYQEAVGSAGQLQALTETEYLALLQAPGVLLQYYAAQPLYLLQAWGGSESLREDMAVRSAAMVSSGQGVALLITDGDGGRWMAETAASLSELELLCAAAGAPNSRLAETSDAVAADTVLTLDVASYPVLTAAQPELVTKGELSQSVQSLFGMNAYLTRVYQNTDGSLVYVESHNTISLSQTGDLTYTGSAGIDLELTATGIARQVELCQKVYDLLSRLWEQAGASGRLSLEEADLQQTDGVLRFGLHVDGLFLERQEGYWATVTVEDGVITGLTAALRLLEETRREQLLPLYQAEVVLPHGKAALRVRLLEQQDGSLQPRICRLTEE